jgi:DNA repair protein RecO (recombination protein O)
MDWDLPAIVLDTRRYGEADLIASVMTEAHGAHRGLVRGGGGRSRAGIWQTGNILQTRWSGRTADQLGYFQAELVHATAAAVLDDPMGLAMLAAVCAELEDALPERQPHPSVFEGLLHLLPHLLLGAATLPDLVRWEVTLLADLGYGLDLTACAVTGTASDLAYVSPRTGRAVSAAAAGVWADRLLPLPPFLAGEASAGPEDWRDGLRLTGHFLTRDVFGARHRPLPLARQMLYDRVAALAAESNGPEAEDAG